MGTKLYIGNLPFTANGSSLSESFSQCGTVVSATVITDRDTGRSKGFGFVEMSTDEEAQNAIQAFHGQNFGGRNITVNEARPQAPRENRSFGGGDRGGYGDRSRAPRRF